jgi:hypothetical protein
MYWLLNRARFPMMTSGAVTRIQVDAHVRDVQQIPRLVIEFGLGVDEGGSGRESGRWS